jgi:hypothetical protein
MQFFETGKPISLALVFHISNGLGGQKVSQSRSLAMAKRKRSRSLDLSTGFDSFFERAMLKRHIEVLIQFEKDRHAHFLRRLEDLREKMGVPEATATNEARTLSHLETRWDEHKSRLKAAAQTMALRAVRRVAQESLSQNIRGWKSVVQRIFAESA